MTTSVLDSGSYSPEMVEAIKRILQLPEKKMRRIVELGKLFRDSEDWQERQEIMQVIAEVLQPVIGGIELTVVTDIDSTVDPEAMRKVESYRKAVGRRIRAARKRKQMTQDELAELSGLPQSHICRLEQGKHAATNETLDRIAKALSLESGDLDPAY